MWAEEKRRSDEMPISISMIVVSSQLIVTIADQVPTFDIARSCKLDLAATAGLAVDQSVKRCVSDEKTALQQLTSQWSKFSGSSKAECIPQESIGGTPSYVSLLTCLQLGKWAR
jgi:hypothetical protein